MSRVAKLVAIVLFTCSYSLSYGQTSLVKDINPGSGWSLYEHLFDKDDTFYFLADSDNGREIWMSDGTATGTQLLKDINVGPDDARVDDLTSYNGAWYFSAFDSLSGVELWRTDGTTVGTEMLIDINPGVSNSNVSNLVVSNGILYFIATRPADGFELWKTDGTTAGTDIVTSINPGLRNASPRNLTDVNGTLYFSAKDGLTGRELWKSDGTATGTVQVKDILSGETGSLPDNFTVLGDKLFFVANDGVHGKELWFSDGTDMGTVLVEDIYPGAIGSEPSKLNIAGDYLFFTATNDTDGLEFWHTDGNLNAPSVEGEDLKPGSADSSPENFITVGNSVFFYANVGDNGFELVKSDGTSTGTSLVKDINIGFGSSFPEMLIEKDGILYFRAISSETGAELWKTDGTEAGTVLVKDINPDTASASPTLAVLENNIIYFSAFNAQKGWQVWRTDGEAENTYMVTDIPQDADFNPIYKPEYLLSDGDRVVFLGLDTLVGEEIHEYIKVPISIDIVDTNNPLFCFGDTNAGLNVAVSGGVGPEDLFTMEWSDAALTGMNLTDLGAGTYTFTVSDCGGQSESMNIEITQPPILSFIVDQTDVTCFGAADGTATINPDGGVGNYTFLWSTTGTNANLTDLMPGNYTFDLTDGNACTMAGDVTITQPDSLVVTINIANTNDISCNGLTDGQITLDVDGGNAGDLNYTWTNMVSDGSIADNLAVGDYQVIVTDSKNCEDSANITLTEPAVVTATVVAVDSLDCNGDMANLTIESPMGGNGVFSFSVNGSTTQSTDLPLNVGGGAQLISVVDGNNCEFTDSIFIFEPDGFIVTIPQPSEPSCFGFETNIIVDEVTGGMMPYTFSVDGGMSQSIADTAIVLAGMHTIEIEDAAGCTTLSEIEIGQPEALIVSLNATDDVDGAATGTATASTIGGTAPYTYLWNTDPVQDSMSAINLLSGIYTVSITDENGCTIVDSVEVDFVSNLSELELFNHFKLAPNPSSGIFNIDLELKTLADIFVNITDLTGKTVYNYQEENVSNTQFLIDLSQYSVGMYLMNISVNNQFLTKKLAVVRQN